MIKKTFDHRWLYRAPDRLVLQAAPVQGGIKNHTLLPLIGWRVLSPGRWFVAKCKREAYYDFQGFTPTLHGLWRRENKVFNVYLREALLKFMEASGWKCIVQFYSNSCFSMAGEIQRFAERDKTPGPTMTMFKIVNSTGQYIGDPIGAHFLFSHGIQPEVVGGCSANENPVCTIGFSAKFQKWFGWSHRGMCGFGIGDEVKKGDCCASSGWTDEALAEHPEWDVRLPIGFRALSLTDARRMAVAYADSVA